MPKPALTEAELLEKYVPTKYWTVVSTSGQMSLAYSDLGKFYWTESKQNAVLFEDTEDASAAAAIHNPTQPCQCVPRVIATARPPETPQNLLLREVQQLRGAIARAGFAVMQTSGDWTIHDISKTHERDQKRTDAIISDNIDMRVAVREAEDQLHLSRRVIETLFAKYKIVDQSKNEWIILDNCPDEFRGRTFKTQFEAEIALAGFIANGPTPDDKNNTDEESARDRGAALSVRIYAGSVVARDATDDFAGFVREKIFPAVKDKTSDWFALVDQMIRLMGRQSYLARWIVEHHAKLQSATLYLRDNRLYFSVIANQIQHDDELQDSLSNLDLLIANAVDLQLLPDLDTMLLPCVAETAAEQCGFGGGVTIARYTIEQPKQEPKNEVDHVGSDVVVSAIAGHRN